jgi:hypothetical protein
MTIKFRTMSSEKRRDHAARMMRWYLNCRYQALRIQNVPQAGNDRCEGDLRLKMDVSQSQLLSQAKCYYRLCPLSSSSSGDRLRRYLPGLVFGCCLAQIVTCPCLEMI